MIEPWNRLLEAHEAGRKALPSQHTSTPIDEGHHQVHLHVAKGCLASPTLSTHSSLVQSTFRPSAVTRLAHLVCPFPSVHLPQCRALSVAEVGFQGFGLWLGRTTDVLGEPFDIIGARYAIKCPAEPKKSMLGDFKCLHRSSRLRRRQIAIAVLSCPSSKEVRRCSDCHKSSRSVAILWHFELKPLNIFTWFGRKTPLLSCASPNLNTVRTSTSALLAIDIRLEYQVESNHRVMEALSATLERHLIVL